MNETNEKELNLKWLLYRALRSWKKVLALGIVVGLLLGLCSFGLNAIKLTNEKFMEKAVQNFERQHAAWIATQELFDVQIDNLEEAKARQEEYNEKSIMMKIDPLRKNVASFELYVQYDYQIDPDKTYQNPDLSNRILSAYATYMTNGELYHYIMQNLNYDIELRYFTEIFGVSVNYDTKFISVSVVHTDAQACQEILTLARTGIESRTESITAMIDEHEISMSNQVAYETIDLTLQDTQKANLQHITDIDRSIQNVNLNRQMWERGVDNDGKEIIGGGPEPEFEYTLWNAVKGGIKLGIIGGVAVVFVLFFCIALSAAISGKLLNPEDMKSRFGLHLIGQLPNRSKKKIQSFAGINRAVAQIGGIAVKPEEYDILARTIGAGIKSELQARKELSCKTIAFVGTAPVKEMERAVAAMGISGYTTVCAPNIFSDAASVDKVAAADCVVLLEKQEKTLMSDVERELAALKVWNKPLLGAVVLNTDTLPSAARKAEPAKQA